MEDKKEEYKFSVNNIDKITKDLDDLTINY